MLPQLLSKDFSHIPDDYLFTVCIEECAEVQKTLTKMIRFGQTPENVAKNRAELIDLSASIHMLTVRLLENGSLEKECTFEEGLEMVGQKIDKVIEYYDRTNGGTPEPATEAV